MLICKLESWSVVKTSSELALEWWVPVEVPLGLILSERPGAGVQSTLRLADGVIMLPGIYSVVDVEWIPVNVALDIVVGHG